MWTQFPRAPSTYLRIKTENCPACNMSDIWGILGYAPRGRRATISAAQYHDSVDVGQTEGCYTAAALPKCTSPAGV